MESKSIPISLMITDESECSYLPGERSRSAFIDPDLPMTSELYSVFLLNGFRRSGNDVYRPYCKNCQECIAVRVPVDQFEPSRNQRRIRAKNADVHIDFIKGPPTDTHYALYERYICSRHESGGMYPPNKDQFDRFLNADWANTYLLTLTLNQELIGVMVADAVLDGLSAVYSFFAPQLHRKSLGVFMVLALIEQCKNLGHTYCYLGYYIKNCQKMNYKSQFLPLEAFQEKHWQPLKAD